MTDCEDDEAEMDRRLAPVGKLTSLERVSLRGCPGVQMAHLANLTGLKSLTLVFGRVSQHAALDRVNYQERMHQCFAAIGKITQLGRLRLAGRVPDGNHGPLWVRADDLVFLRGLTNMKSLRLRISCEEAESRACLAAIGHLTHLRRLWLDGNVVSGGVAELAPLTSLEQLTSQDWVATPAWIESLSALKGLRVVRIPGLDGGLAMRTAEADPRRRAVHLLRQSRPGLVIDGDYNNVWLESLGEAFRGEPFDDQLQDLDSFLDFCPAGQ